MGSVALEGFGSGGAALNFKVVPGLTQPGTASENTIWVKTEKIGSWYFSATKPENMQEWDVWFKTVTESDVEFNALRKNGIQVYPWNAYQMMDGTLMAVDAMSYRDGEWVDWITYLYNKGNIYSDVTGGIKAYAYKPSTSGSTVATPTFTNSDGVITVTVSANNQIGSLFVEKAIDLTQRNYLEINVTSRAANASTITMFVSKTKANNYTMAASIALNNTGKTSLDISTLTGEYYIAVVLGGGGSKSFAFDSWGLK